MKRYQFLFIILVFFASCGKRNFFPDQDDPGLSLLTAHGFNIASNYINGQPYVNPFGGILRGNYLPLLQKVASTDILDTLSLSWPIEPNDGTSIPNSKYYFISLLLPVSKSFNKQDFLSFNGQRFASDSARIYLQTNNFNNRLWGKGNLYFVEIKPDDLINPNSYIISGLFDGNIGDSILVTKGRFDFRIAINSLNF